MLCYFRLHTESTGEAYLIGDFNHWSTTATPMHREDDRFEVIVDLTAGLHAYAYFIIDEAGLASRSSGFACCGSELWVPASHAELVQQEVLKN